MPCLFIPHLQLKIISQQKIAMNPDILVCTTFITTFILEKNEVVRAKKDVVFSSLEKFELLLSMYYRS